MNVAGRKIVRIDLDVAERRASALASAASTPRVTSSVLRAELLLDDEQQAGHVVDDRVADRRRMAFARPCATSPSRSGAPPRRDTTMRSPGPRPIATAAAVRDGEPLVRRVDEAAGFRRDTPSRAAVDDLVERARRARAADRDRRAPGAADRAGPRSRRSRRRAPPSAAAGSSTARASSAPSATASSTSCRSSAARLSDDSGDSMHRRVRATGSCDGARVPSRSCTSWRASMQIGAARRESARPTTGRAPTSSGSSATPGTPVSAFSSGTLTSASTSGVDRPGASVWISTSGGANSGKTSSGTLRGAARRAPARRSP